MSAPVHPATRAVPDGQLRLITKVARMYHERGIRQVDIADTLHLSQARVSRLLKRAHELGIVRTVVLVPHAIHTELEEALEQRYSLAEAVVVEVEGGDADILAGLGSAGATYLESTLTGGERVGISPWSQTLLSVVERMRPLRLAGAENVVQLIGGLGAHSAQARANRLLGEPAMQAIEQEWAGLTMCLVGIGSLPPSEFLRASGNAVDAEDQAALVVAGAVGDVCHRFFDAAGASVSTALDERVVGISADALRAVPRRIGISGGPSKAEAVRAAVTGGWVNVLVTDIGTAHRLLEEPAQASG